MENKSGQGKQELIPEEIREWSWGAFLLGWLWGLFNNTYIALLTLIPFAGFIVAIILGVKGNEWAWRNKDWDNIEHFKKVQRNWTAAGLIIYGISILGIVIAII